MDGRPTNNEEVEYSYDYYSVSPPPQGGGKVPPSRALAVAERGAYRGPAPSSSRRASPARHETNQERLRELEQFRVKRLR